jgi:hypothetical protein
MSGRASNKILVAHIRVDISDLSTPGRHSSVARKELAF